MRKISAVMIMGFFLLLTNFNLKAQPASNAPFQTIEPLRLDIAHYKTTNIIFPHAIVSVDRGSKDVLAQKAKGADYILQLKAAKDSFPETNISVITSDGKLSSFVVNYSPEPTTLNLSLAGIQSTTGMADSKQVNEAELQSFASAALVAKQKIWGIKDKDFGIRFQLNGLFIQDDVLYYRLVVGNDSNINYDIDQLRFFIRDQKKAKRTATQELEMKPLYVHNGATQVIANSQRTSVFALPKFTIPDNKVLVIQLMEKNGGRHLELEVKNKVIVRSDQL